MSQELEIDIFPDGRTKMHVKGVPGRRCVDLTREFETALGGPSVVVTRTFTSEYHQATETQKREEEMKR